MKTIKNIFFTFILVSSVLSPFIGKQAVHWTSNYRVENHQVREAAIPVLLWWLVAAGGTAVEVLFLTGDDNGGLGPLDDLPPYVEKELSDYTEETLEDGTRIRDYGNGTQVAIFPNGDTVTERVLQFIAHANGEQHELLYIFTVAVINGQTTIIVRMPNQLTVTWDQQQKTVTIDREGLPQLVFSDVLYFNIDQFGNITIHTSTSRIFILKDGTIVVDEPGLRRITFYMRDGTVRVLEFMFTCYIDENGRFIHVSDAGLDRYLREMSAANGASGGPILVD